MFFDSILFILIPYPFQSMRLDTKKNSPMERLGYIPTPGGQEGAPGAGVREGGDRRGLRGDLHGRGRRHPPQQRRSHLPRRGLSRAGLNAAGERNWLMFLLVSSFLLQRFRGST